MRRRVHIIVSGRVQGVNYRASARDKALSLDIDGWVRNLHGGSVEILAEGDKLGIGAFIAWCGNGPRWASVDEIKVMDQAPLGDLSGFIVRRDG